MDTIIKKVFRLFVRLLFWLQMFSSPALCRTNVSVTTSVGTIVGFQDVVQIDGDSRPVTKFYGIPYAENTGGVNRFEKPVPKAPFQTPYSAMRFSAYCFQISTDPIKVSEDCLFLNIYLPNHLAEVKSLPVMIWIHGGSFLHGAGSIYTSEALSVFGNVVVVTINYRLEMFGFLRNNNGTLIGNQGLWDQQLAIQWVNKHIASFGGNPDEVTIFGESAGAGSVLLQALYPGNRGLFKRVIAESGSALAPWAVRDPQGDILIDVVGCANQTDPLFCLRYKSPYELESKGYKLLYAPSVDGDFLVEHPHDIIYGKSSKSATARDFFASLHILTGVNNFDGALNLIDIWPLVLHEKFPNITVNRTQFLNLVVPATVNSLKPGCDAAKRELSEAIAFQYTDWTDPNNDTKTRDMLVTLSSDLEFFSGQIATVQKHSQLQAGNTYMYEFAVNPTKHVLPTPSWIKGADHADEIPFVFGYPVSDAFSPNMTSTDREKVLSRAMLTLWTNFAISSDPNQPKDAKKYINTVWPEYNMDDQSFFQFSTNLGPQCVKQYFYSKRMEFWLNHIPNIMKIACQFV